LKSPHPEFEQTVIISLQHGAALQRAKRVPDQEDSQSPGILILSILTGQTKTLCTYRVRPLTLTAISRGFEAEVFTGR